MGYIGMFDLHQREKRTNGVARFRSLSIDRTDGISWERREEKHDREREIFVHLSVWNDR